MDGGGMYSAEALRWLNIAERLLVARDLHSAKTFAIRAREADPRYDFADRIIAIVDTLIAGESLINRSLPDYYAILQLGGWTQDPELVSTQYQKLAVLLNPNQNKLAFADQAFRLVTDAWSVLSNPSKKALYDSQLGIQTVPFGLNFSHQWQQPVPSRPSYAQERQQQQPQVEQPVPIRPTYASERQQPQPPSVPGRPSFAHIMQQQHRQQEPSSSSSRLNYTSELRQQEQPALTRPIFAPERQQQQLQQDQSVPIPTPTRPSYNLELQQQERSVLSRPTYMQERRQQAQPVLSWPSPMPERQQQKQQEPRPQLVSENHNPVNNNNSNSVGEVQRPASNEEDVIGPSFWTACPYCYYMYEYPKKYEQCALRCQNCRRAFHAESVPAPPVAENAKSFCCWGFYPVGYSKQRSARNSVYYDDDDDDFVEISDSSDDSDDDDWDGRKEAKKARRPRGRPPGRKNRKNSQVDSGKQRNQSNTDTSGNLDGRSKVRRSNLSNLDGSSLGVAMRGKKQTGKGAKDLGRLDLNVEFSNEVEEPAAAAAKRGKGVGNGVDDNIEGSGFFEGLDEFLSSLPILNAVGDDRVKA